MGVLLNNETVKEIANIGAGLNNMNDTSSKKEATVFVVLDMHPGLMNPTETLGRYTTYQKLRLPTYLHQWRSNYFVRDMWLIF